MDKIQELNTFILQYGYIAIFMCIFLQELGVPNPVTNELILLFSGYLTYTGAFSFTKVILIAVSADITGTTVLYFIFYALSKQYIFNNLPKWLAKLSARLENLKQRINSKSQWEIFLFRLTPFIRGYVSVAAGILQLRPILFLPNVILSAVIWSGGLVLAGRLLGPYWNSVVQKTGAFYFAGLIILLVIALFFVGKYFIRKQLAKESKEA